MFYKDNEYQYQTKQRDCNIRWNLFKLEGFVKDKTVIDIGCAEGWFVEKSLEAGAKRAIGVDLNDIEREGKGEYYLHNEFFETSANIAILLSVPVDIEITTHLKRLGVKTVFFEPYLDIEKKSMWKEEEWLNRFREAGYDFMQIGVSDRGRSLYVLRFTKVRMETQNGNKVAIKTNPSANEAEFYKNFNNQDFILPYEFKNEDTLVLPWTETTFRLAGTSTHIEEIERAVNWLHSLGVVHGDIRVSNIVIYRKKAYLIDYDWWRYGDPKEDCGVGDLKNRRGIEYIKEALSSSRIKYYE